MDRRDKQNLASVLVVLALVVVGYWLTVTLRRQSAIQDCLLARGRNCDQLIDK